MASVLALGPVSAAALAKLKADAGLTTLVPTARIVDDARTGIIPPYVLVEGESELPFNTMGPPTAPKWGGATNVRVRVVSQYRGDAEVTQIGHVVKAALDGQPLTVAGFPSVIVEFGSGRILKDTIAGVVTREFVLDFAITVHQS